MLLSINWAKPELELDELDELPPSVAALIAPADPEPLEDVLDDEPVDALDPPDTDWPGEMFSSDTIVPFVGATNRVAARSVSALFTLD